MPVIDELLELDEENDLDNELLGVGVSVPPVRDGDDVIVSEGDILSEKVNDKDSDFDDEGDVLVESDRVDDWDGELVVV